MHYAIWLINPKKGCYIIYLLKGQNCCFSDALHQEMSFLWLIINAKWDWIVLDNFLCQGNDR